MRRFLLGLLAAPLLLASPAEGQGPGKSKQGLLPPTGVVEGTIHVDTFGEGGHGPLPPVMQLKLYRVINQSNAWPRRPRLVPVGAPGLVRVRVGGTVSYRMTNVPVGAPLKLVATYSGPHPWGRQVRVVGAIDPFVVGIGESLRRDLRVMFWRNLRPGEF
jgi:hypothetical protein